MSGLVNDLIEEHRYLIGTRDIELILDISSEPCRLPLTACRIVVGNFLRNALQYADDGVVEVSFGYPQLRLVNRIRETLQSETSSDFGYGLGLELMRQLSARLGWHIEVAVEQQCYIVTLAFEPAPAAEQPPAEEDNEPGQLS